MFHDTAIFLHLAVHFVGCHVSVICTRIAVEKCPHIVAWWRLTHNTSFFCFIRDQVTIGIEAGLGELLQGLCVRFVSDGRRHQPIEIK